MERLFGWVRYVAVFGVAASALLSAGLYLTTAVRAVLLVIASLGDLGHESTVKTLLIAGIELADALLVATGLLIVAIAACRTIHRFVALNQALGGTPGTDPGTWFAAGLMIGRSTCCTNNNLYKI